MSVGFTVGVTSGLSVGFTVGVTSGLSVGFTVGVTFGSSVGFAVGVAVGSIVGVAVGSSVGASVGSTILFTTSPVYAFVVPKATKLFLSINLMFFNGSAVPSSYAVGISSHAVSVVNTVLFVLYNLPFSVPTNI